MGRTPLLLPLVAIVSGILLASWLSVSPAWLIIPAVILGGIAFLLKRNAFGIFALFFSIGLLTAIIHQPKPLRFHGKHTIEAIILQIEDASTSGRNTIVEVYKVDSIATNPFRLRVHTISERPHATAGQILIANLDIRPLRPLTQIPDAIDFTKNLKRDGVLATAEVYRDDMAIIGNAPGVLNYFRRLHADFSLALQQTDISPEAISMLSPMLLGNANDISPSRRQIYSAAGLSHLLALSGMHVAIIAMIISVALWPLYVGRHNRSRMLLTIIALWGYACLTGLSPSVTRAVIMTSIFMIGRIIERKSVPLNSLCLAAILILIFNPSDVYAIGFQMSFAAVAGIILFYPVINCVNRREHPRLYMLASYPALSVSAMSLTGIVAICHFHTFPLLFLFANLLVAPIVPLFVSSGALALILSLASINFPLLNSAVNFLANAIDTVARTTANIPLSTINHIYLPAFVVVAFLLGLTIMAYGLGSKHRFSTVLGIIIIFGGVGHLLIVPAKTYANVESYVIEDYRHKHLILRQDNRCFLYSSSPVEQERKEYLELYTRVLADFLALRHIDSLTLLPPDIIPSITIHGDTFIVCLDSCHSESR